MKQFIKNNMHYIMFVLYIVFGFVFIPVVCNAQMFEAPVKNKTITNNDSITTFKYKDNGVVYPVYRGKRGGLYIWRKGIRNPKKLQRVSIPKEVQIKMGRKYND